MKFNNVKQHNKRSNDEREGGLRGFFELDHVVFSTNIFQLLRERDQTQNNLLVFRPVR